jgi:hypothetical protein
VAPAKPIGLGDYRMILVAHNQEYRNSKGADRREIIAVIMQEMVAQSKGTIQKDLLKGLGQVSHPIKLHNPGISLDCA